MTKLDYKSILGAEGGLTSADAYDTAWVARVPDAQEPSRPAYPQALVYLQEHQLTDGGWGEPCIYYAHERTISTLAAMLALLEWGEARDSSRIERAVHALQIYGNDLTEEPNEPIGFELLLPRLAVEVARFGIELPTGAWDRVEKMAAEKSALIGALQVQYNRPRSWWFNMEMLLEYQLVEIDERILNEYGAIAISPSATAAYLRARRLQGQDAPQAAAFLDRVVRLCGGGAGVCYPIEGFEIMWALDNYLRAGLEPNEPFLQPMIQWLYEYWNMSPSGMSHSQAFPVDDGDDTAVAYRVLRSVGIPVSDKPLLRYWDEENCHYYTYLDERTPSVSSAVHALNAFRQARWNKEHERIAGHLATWLRSQMQKNGMLHDKWHISPLYATSRAIQPLIGLDDQLARQCTDFILAHQQPNGGWGYTGNVTLEETALAVLGLIAARRGGLLQSNTPLQRAASFLATRGSASSVERLWIGKGLYRPVGVVNTVLQAARIALRIEEVPLLTGTTPRSFSTYPTSFPS